MKPVSLLIKPASSLCNMACSYCFYHDIADTRESIAPSIMSDAVRSAVITKALQDATGALPKQQDATSGGSHPQETKQGRMEGKGKRANLGNASVTFAFQGGEPTLAGLEYFKDFVAKVEQYNTKKIPVAYALQTNGLAIDRDWAEFFHEHNFLIGLSLDGTEDINNALRLDKTGNSTYKKVLQVAKLFDQYQVAYNILTVVTTQLAYHIEEVFASYMDLGFQFLQFIPCLDPISKSHNDYSVPPKVYGEFLHTLFTLWYKRIKQGKGISIRYFDNLLGLYLGYPPESCDMVGHCSIQKVVEADGTVFPCDFYTRDQDAIGNITEDSIAKLESTTAAEQFLQESYVLPQQCQYCQWVRLCRNGCKRHRDPVTGVNKYCSAYQSFFTTHNHTLVQLARRLKQRTMGGGAV